MESIADARREAALEIQKLAEDFEKEDEAAFRRTRIACWVIAAIVTIIILGMIALGGDARYLGIFWLIIVGLIWAGYALSSRRQRQQTGRLRALATRGGRGGDLQPAPELDLQGPGRPPGLRPGRRHPDLCIVLASGPGGERQDGCLDDPSVRHGGDLDKRQARVSGSIVILVSRTSGARFGGCF
jgi:hypothetical protein